MSTSTQDGYSAVEVELRPSREYQSVGVKLRREFGVPLSETDVIEPLHEAARFAREVAEKELDQLVAEIEAKTNAEVQRQTQASGATPPPPSTPAAPPATPGQPQWAQASRPGGKGTFRYRPTSDLPSDALKAMVSEAIRAAGADPSMHVVYDERIGPRGLEATGQGYSFASVKPTENNPAYQAMLKPANNGKLYPRASFYVDFNDDGTVRVKASAEYLAAARQASQPAPAAPPADSLPF